jgi:hypothetical protein
MYTIQLQFKELGPALKPSFMIGYILISYHPFTIVVVSELDPGRKDF